MSSHGTEEGSNNGGDGGGYLPDTPDLPDVGDFTEALYNWAIGFLDAIATGAEGLFLELAASTTNIFTSAFRPEYYGNGEFGALHPNVAFVDPSQWASGPVEIYTMAYELYYGPFFAVFFMFLLLTWILRYGSDAIANAGLDDVVSGGVLNEDRDSKAGKYFFVLAVYLLFWPAHLLFLTAIDGMVQLLMSLNPEAFTTMQSGRDALLQGTDSTNTLTGLSAQLIISILGIIIFGVGLLITIFGIIVYLARAALMVWYPFIFPITYMAKELDPPLIGGLGDFHSSYLKLYKIYASLPIVITIWFLLMGTISAKSTELLSTLIPGSSGSFVGMLIGVILFTTIIAGASVIAVLYPPVMLMTGTVIKIADALIEEYTGVSVKDEFGEFKDQGVVGTAANSDITPDIESISAEDLIEEGEDSDNSVSSILQRAGEESGVSDTAASGYAAMQEAKNEAQYQVNEISSGFDEKGNSGIKDPERFEEIKNETDRLEVEQQDISQMLSEEREDLETLQSINNRSFNSWGELESAAQTYNNNFDEDFDVDDYDRLDKAREEFRGMLSEKIEAKEENVEQLTEDLEERNEELEELENERQSLTSDSLGYSVGQTIRNTSEQAEEAKETIKGGSGYIKDQASEASEQVQGVAEDVRETVREELPDDPVGTTREVASEAALTGAYKTGEAYGEYEDARETIDETTPSEAAQKTKEEVKQKGKSATETVSEVSQSATETLEETKESALEELEEKRREVSETASKTRDVAAETLTEKSDTAIEQLEELDDKSEELANKARKRASETREHVEETASDVSSQLEAAKETSREKRSMIESTKQEKYNQVREFTKSSKEEFERGRQNNED